MQNRECGCVLTVKHYGPFEATIERTDCKLHAAAPLLLKALQEILPIVDDLKDVTSGIASWKSAHFLNALDHAHIAVLEASESTGVIDTPVGPETAVAESL